MARRMNTDTTHYLDEFFAGGDGRHGGLASWWGPIVEGSGKPRPVNGWGARWSDVASRLERLTADQRIVLELAHHPNPWPLPTPEDAEDLAAYGATFPKRAVQRRQDRERYGERFGVAMVTSRARRDFVAMIQAEEKRVGTDPRKLIRVIVEGKVVGEGERGIDAGAACPFAAYVGGSVSAWRRDPLPQHFTGGRAAARAPTPLETLAIERRRGLLWWLRGTTIDAPTIKAIRAEAEALYDDAKRAWAEVAPKPERCPKCNGARGCEVCGGRGSTVPHDGHRRAAYGPVQASTVEADDGDRPSGEYEIADAPGVPWRSVAS